MYCLKREYLLIIIIIIPGEIVFLEDRGGAFKLRSKHFDIRHPGR